MAELWKPGWTEFEGDVLLRAADGHGADADRADPDHRRRAVRHRLPPGRAPRRLGRRPLHDRRGDRASPAGWPRRAREIGAEGDFSVITALNDAFLPEHFERAEAGGVTDCWTMPWAYYHGLDATLEQKVDGMERFAADVLRPAERLAPSGSAERGSGSLRPVRPSGAITARYSGTTSALTAFGTVSTSSSSHAARRPAGPLPRRRSDESSLSRGVLVRLRRPGRRSGRRRRRR